MAKQPRRDLPSLHGAKALLEPVAIELGLELVDVRYDIEDDALYLRLVIGHPQRRIDLNDCERFHRRAIEPMERFTYDYLEVSSPGAERPLKKASDFERHEGDWVEVRFYQKIEGKKSAIGRLLAKDAERIRLATSQGERTFPMSKVSLVKPVVTLEEHAREQVILEEGTWHAEEQRSEIPIIREADRGVTPGDGEDGTHE